MSAENFLNSTFVSHPYSQGDTWIPKKRALASIEAAIAAKDEELAKHRDDNERLREALENARSQAIDDTLAALTAHELYQYRPKAFHGFIEYAETLKDEANAQLWRAVITEPTP